MQKLPSKRAQASRAPRAMLGACLAAAAALATVACNDTPSAPSGPGNVLVDDSHQDAVANFTQDTGVPDASTTDAAYDAAYDGNYMSTGYEDAQSPKVACASCSCSNKVGYCLENGTSLTFSGPVIQGYCSLSNLSAPAVGCNPLPEACKANPTCECVLDAVQPPLGCYPECTTSLGYIDVFCNTP